MPNTAVARHWERVKCQLWPINRANPTPIRPESKNRNASAVSGGASATIILADVKAEDHIITKAIPIKIERKSIIVLSFQPRLTRTL